MNKVEKYRHHNIFGPVAKIAGITIFVVGMVMLFSSFYGFIPIIIGAFVGFSYYCTLIDYNRKRVKYANCLFGIFIIGKWVQVHPNMSTGVEKSKGYWRAYSRGNRVLDLSQIDYSVYLYNSTNQRMMPLATFGTITEAKNKLLEISQHLLI